MTNKKYKQIHWQDGMKLNKDHFREADLYHNHQQLITRSIFTNENNFGVLPSYDKTKYTFDIGLAVEDSYLHITNFEISALMLNGMLINISSEEIANNKIDPDAVKLKFKYDDFNEKKFALLLKVNTNESIGFGNYDSEDLPIRRPYLIPFFEFILSPINKLKESFYSDDFFIISKFEFDQNQIAIDKEYIPPCTSIISNKILTEKYNFTFDCLNSIETYLIDIAKKNIKLRGGNFEEVQILLANNILTALSSIKFDLKHNGLYDKPLDFVIKVKALANIIQKTIEMRTSTGKDAFLNEVIRIIGGAKHEFEDMLKQMVNLEYRHFDISSSINASVNFVETIHKLFRTISEGERKVKPSKSFDLKIKG